MLVLLGLVCIYSCGGIDGASARMALVPAASPVSKEDRLSPCGGSDDGGAISPPVLAATVGSEEDRSSPCGGWDDGRTSSSPAIAAAASEAMWQSGVSEAPGGRAAINPSRDSRPGDIMTAAGICLEASSPPVLAATAGSEEVRASPYGGKDDGRDSSPLCWQMWRPGPKGSPRSS